MSNIQTYAARVESGADTITFKQLRQLVTLAMKNDVPDDTPVYTMFPRFKAPGDLTGWRSPTPCRDLIILVDVPDEDE